MKWQIRGKDVIPGTINFGVVHAGKDDFVQNCSTCIYFHQKPANIKHTNDNYYYHYYPSISVSDEPFPRRRTTGLY
jgi:hypothetical protein